MVEPSCGKKALRLHAEGPYHIKNIRTIKTNQSCGKKALRLHAEGPYHIKNIRTIKTNQVLSGSSKATPAVESMPDKGCMSYGGLWPPCPLDPPRALRPPGPQL
ncbi:hypothetical protein DPMN_080349 [Dreissena polymorpha]|uniref:Uncharacterized protein n=1 Tax=Dreissena polymorpha TaxID=45954 RepID=A0A9D3YVG3_DREPO|nr:hypothetical protein DPMN_080349 [Dreissena polymorpha]